jgi:hypothetical protein
MIWKAPHVVELPPIDGSRVFDVYNGRVVVIPMSRSWHARARTLLDAKCPLGWKPLTSFREAGEAPKCLLCQFVSRRGEAERATLDEFVLTHSHVLEQSLNITSCKYLKHEFAEPLRTFVTAGNSEMLDDLFHADGCRDWPRPKGSNFFTGSRTRTPSGTRGGAGTPSLPCTSAARTLRATCRRTCASRPCSASRRARTTQWSSPAHSCTAQPTQTHSRQLERASPPDRPPPWRPSRPTSPLLTCAGGTAR